MRGELVGAIAAVMLASDAIGARPMSVLAASPRTTVSNAASAGLTPLALPAPVQVVTFESIVEQLGDPDPGVRREAIRLLAEAGYPEAGEPIARLLTDPDDQVQLDAMTAELHLLLIEPPAERRRVGLIFEPRGRVPAERLFEEGPLAIGPGPVPDAVFTGLLGAMGDDSRRVAMEALYTLAVLAPAGRSSGPWRALAASHLAAALADPQEEARLAVLRVIGRVFGTTASPRAPQAVGDAVVGAMNDRRQAVRIAATDTLGRLRYERGLQALLERFASGRRGEEADAAFAALAAIGHPSASPLFIEQLAAGRGARRRSAIEGLARTGPPEVLADIRTRTLRDDDRAIALAAAFAAIRLGAGPVDPVLSALLQPALEAQAFTYLVELVGPASRLFVPYAQDPDERIRLRLADAAALSGDLNALPLVQALLGDPQPPVAAAAARAVSWLELRR